MNNWEMVSQEPHRHGSSSFVTVHLTSQLWDRLKISGLTTFLHGRLSLMIGMLTVSYTGASMICLMLLQSSRMERRKDLQMTHSTRWPNGCRHVKCEIASLSFNNAFRRQRRTFDKMWPIALNMIQRRLVGLGLAERTQMLFRRFSAANWMAWWNQKHQMGLSSTSWRSCSHDQGDFLATNLSGYTFVQWKKTAEWCALAPCSHGTCSWLGSQGLVYGQGSSCALRWFDWGISLVAEISTALWARPSRR